MMERLTKRTMENVNGKQIVICNHKEEDCNDSCMYGSCKWNEKALKKLKEYEDLEEQGLLLRLPCKVGSTVYRICPQSKYVKFGDMWDGKKVERPCQRCPWSVCECYNIGFQKDMDNIVREVKVIDLSWIIRRKDYLGSIYFLTKAEAEAALKAMEKG